MQAGTAVCSFPCALWSFHQLGWNWEHLELASSAASFSSQPFHGIFVSLRPQNFSTFFVVWLGILSVQLLSLRKGANSSLEASLQVSWSRLYFQIVFLIMPSNYMWSGLWTVHRITSAIQQAPTVPGGNTPPVEDQTSVTQTHMHSSLLDSLTSPQTALFLRHLPAHQDSVPPPAPAPHLSLLLQPPWSLLSWSGSWWLTIPLL